MIELTFFSAISAILLFGFIITGVVCFGLQPSYSAYSSLWGKAVPMNNMNLWSVITLVAAFLLCPPLLELGVGSLWQFLGFLTPVYLIVVSLTPEWEINKTQHIIHMLFAILCVLGGLGWLVFIMHAYKALAIAMAFTAAMALFSGTARTSAVFWGEMLMFLSVYLTVFFALL